MEAINLEIRTALNDIDMNRARFEEAEVTLRFEEERLQGEEARFEVGIGTTRQVIEAQRELILAQSLVLRAQIDLIQSNRLLDKVLGRTLQEFGVRVADAIRTNVN